MRKEGNTAKGHPEYLGKKIAVMDEEGEGRQTTAAK